MSKQTELNLYIARLQGRLRLATSLRGAAIFAATALAFTVALVMALNRYAFPAQGVSAARTALVVALVLAAELGLVWPLLRLTRARAVRAAELAHPELEQRLTTFQQRPQADPFRELLAADTLERTHSAPPSTLAPSGLLLAFGGAGLACLAVLLWIVIARPGYLGYGASLLWTGPKKNVTPLYALAVMPGDVAVRRNSDQLITAELTNLQPEKVQLFAHFASAKGWEPVVMQPQAAGGAPAYQFLFTGLPETVEYYVAAGPLISPHYKVRVVDLPSVKALRVTYHYPRWTGMKAVTEDHSGDLRALEGTDATIEVEVDRPLTGGQLTVDGGKAIQLTPGAGNRYTGIIHMEKDGAYHVAALDAGQPVRLSEDYFIATEKAAPPEVAIQRPGGDYRASPIEEVTVGVKAADTFGLRDVHLHYSVNGGPDRDVSLLKSAGAQTAEGAYTLHLEDFKLVPGDLVSLYATAKDGHAETRTQISFIQAEPFEREFSQSQQAGGGGGSGQNNQTEISKREKELITATWKQQNDKAATPKDAATAGQFLADAQQKLRDQVMALSARIESRDLSQANEEFTSFEKDMQAAAAAMVPSAGKLQGMQWSDALPLEQKALQSLLRAEATFRQIQVAFGQQSGGGGGGGSAGRDLASLFDLELDTEKNQYETAQTASPAEQHAKEVEDALAKLDALAKRQEELASQQHNPQRSLQERWQQEMLRREAEQLQRQMEQLAQEKDQDTQRGSNTQGGSQQGSQSSQSGSPSASSASGQTGRQSGALQAGKQASGQSASSAENQRIEQAANRLRQATEAMKRSTGTPGTDAARQAADRLRDARDLFGTAQRHIASGKMDDLSHEANRMVGEERAQADRIDKLAGNQASGNPGNPLDQTGATARREERNRLAAERQQLSNDLSALQRKVRDAARVMGPNQPDAAKTLRDALTEIDQTDLDNHVQRTADWLRRGINPKSNGTEEGIAQGLEKLDWQLHQAQQAMGRNASSARPGQRGSAPGDQTAALGQVERLRSQLEAMAASRTGNSGRPPQNGKESGQDGRQRNGQVRNGSSPGQNGSDNRNGQRDENAQGSGSAGQHSSGNPQTTQNGRGSNRQRGAQSGDDGANRADSPGNPTGDVRTGGGGGNDGTVWGNLNTGNNQYGPASAQPVAPGGALGNPADAERTFRQGMAQLSQLRQTLQSNPQAAKEVRELTRQMQRLGPSRFPGNPAIVEQMHQEILSALDRLELQLQRDSTTEARTGKSQDVPSGYQDSVADYYRRLSKTP